jgi:hypothetical protein
MPWNRGVAPATTSALRLAPGSADEQRMLEVLAVFVGIGALAAAALAWALFGAETILLAGLELVALGFALGIPTGFWYHVELRRALALAGPLPERWWLHPTRHHDAIPAARRSRVLPWCYAGALGWAISALGCAVFALGTAKLLRAF